MRLTLPRVNKLNPTKPGHSPGFVILIAPAGSYRISAYLAAARALQMPILVVSNSEHSLVPEIARGITVDFTQPNAALAIIMAAIEPFEVACVLATDDGCVELGGRLAERLGLAHNSVEAARLTQRKDLAREALKQAGCRVPDFRVIALADLEISANELPYPAVAKPLGLAASRGVIRADDPTQLIAAGSRIDAILDRAEVRGFARAHLLVESYIDGNEYAVEGFMIDGQFTTLAIFDKPEPLRGPYFEETYYLTPSRLPGDHRDALVAEIASCCQAYGLSQGPVHAEARIDADGPVLIELAARTIGGQCGQLIEFSLGQKLEQIVLQGMCGTVPSPGNHADAAGVLMIPITDRGILKRVEGLTEAMRTRYVQDIEVHIQPGYELVPLPEGASYLGFIFAQAPDFDATYRALKSAYQKLRFVTQPKWKLEST